MLDKYDNMQKGMILALIGAIMLLIALLADVIGWGSDGFGIGQVLLLIIGIAALAAGGYAILQERKKV